MARGKMTAKAYININGKDVLWYEIDSDRNVTWHLPENIKEKQQMLKNMGEDMSRYYKSNPDSVLLQG